MADASYVYEQAKGRMVFNINGTLATVAKNNGWADADENGTVTGETFTWTWNNSLSYFQLEFSGGAKLFIDCQV